MQTSMLLSNTKYLTKKREGGNATAPAYLLVNIILDKRGKRVGGNANQLTFQLYLQLLSTTKQRAATMPVWRPIQELHAADQLLVNTKAMVKHFTYIVPYLVWRVVIRGVVPRWINMSLSVILFSQENDKKSKEAKASDGRDEGNSNQGRVVVVSTAVSSVFRILQQQNLLIYITGKICYSWLCKDLKKISGDKKIFKRKFYFTTSLNVLFSQVMPGICCWVQDHLIFSYSLKYFFRNHRDKFGKWN